MTPKGQRTSLHMANVLSLVLFIGFVLNYTTQELPKANVTQLDTSNVTYCELMDCEEIQGLVLENGDIAQEEVVETKNGVLLTLEFRNSGMLQGERELWLRVISAECKILEMASVEISLSLRTKTVAEFELVSNLDQIRAGKLLLGY